MRIKALFVHSGQALLEAALIASLLAMLAVGTTFAAKGGNGGGGTSGATGSSLAVVMVTDNNGDGAANWNDWITFNVTTSSTSQPFVKVDCMQGSSWVYTNSAGFYANYAWNPYFDLASTTWSSGSASCTATLYKYGSNGKVTNLAKMTFTVAA
jgi:hypothetical protein